MRRFEDKSSLYISASRTVTESRSLRNALFDRFQREGFYFRPKRKSTPSDRRSKAFDVDVDVDVGDDDDDGSGGSRPVFCSPKIDRQQDPRSSLFFLYI